MIDAQSQKIFNQLMDHEKRIRALEGSSNDQIAGVKSVSGKQKTLREIVKGRKFKNGQEQVAIIVGYYERVLGTPINKSNLKSEWINAKITNKYSTEFITRAKDILIRVSPEGVCDLTQTGENFFDEFLKNESIKTTSK